MRDPRIILVDGMPGTGKSTISQFIQRQLNANDRPAFWYHEEHVDHPVRTFFEPHRHRARSDYGDECGSRWQRFAAELGGQERIAVLDAALLQNHVRSMLIFNSDRGAVLDLMHDIESRIASLNPVLIYLKPRDVERNLRDVVEARGRRLLDLWIEAHDSYPYTQRTASTGYRAFIDFWMEFDRLSDIVFHRSAISKRRQLASNDDWNDRYTEILDFLRLPRVSESVSKSTWERFTGNYAPIDDHSSSGFTLESKDGCLIASTDQPTFDCLRGPIGRFREVRLIPRGDHRFYAAAWPYEVHFIEQRSGANVEVRALVFEEGSTDFLQVYLRQTSSPGLGRATGVE